MQMKIKNLCHVLFLIVLVACFSACGDKTSKLKKAIEQANSECPVSAGEMGELTSFTYDESDNVMVMKFSLNEELIKADVLKTMPDQMKASAVAMVKIADGDMKEMIDLLKEAKSGMRIIYKGKASGETATLTLTYDELMNAEKATDTDDAPMDYLETQVKMFKPQLPMEIEKGMSIVDINLKGLYLVYDVSVDEDTYSIDALNESKDEVKKSIKESLDSDPTSKQLILQCKKAGKGIAYCYKGDQSGDECLIKIKAEEFK